MTTGQQRVNTDLENRGYRQIRIECESGVCWMEMSSTCALLRAGIVEAVLEVVARRSERV